MVYETQRVKGTLEEELQEALETIEMLRVKGTLEEELQEALDKIEMLNEFWDWETVHRNDEGSFIDTQKFLESYGYNSKPYKF